MRSKTESRASNEPFDGDSPKLTSRGGGNFSNCDERSHCLVGMRHSLVIVSCAILLASGCLNDAPLEKKEGRASAQFAAPKQDETPTPDQGTVRAPQQTPSTFKTPSTPAKPSPQPISESTAPLPFEGSLDIIDVKNEGPVRILKSVRTARHERFDRVVFEFDTGMPGYHVEYIDRPVRACGSGDVVPLLGDAWLEVRMSPTNAHDEAGNPTIFPSRENPEHPIMRELVRTCDFEAVTSYVIGVSSPNRLRVLELRDPARLVVDVRHDRKKK